MSEGDLPDRMVLRPSRLRWSVLLAVSLAFTATAALSLSGDPHSVFEWLGLAFFGLGALVAIMALLPGANVLTLERDAFTMRHLHLRSWRFRWIDVGPFLVWMSRGQAAVIFDEPGRQGAAAALNRRSTGASSALPDTYGLGAQDLADLLERWRRRARRDAGLPE